MFRDIQIVIITNFVIVLSVGIKRVDCSTHVRKSKVRPTRESNAKPPNQKAETLLSHLEGSNA